MAQTAKEADDRDSAREVARIDALTAGPVILARMITVSAYMLFFDIADAPNLSARLSEAGIDPVSFRRMPRLSAPAEQDGGASADRAGKMRLAGYDVLRYITCSVIIA